ncbi:MAG: RidA family protein [Coriobacteriia bacterium]|nr:RidA family protein [Coriobacteriia bacterium]
MAEKIYTPAAPEPIGPYSQAVRVGMTVYLSGQTPIDPATGELAGAGIAEQTEQVCKNLGAVLEAADLSFNDVVKANCYLLDMGDFAAFNEVYARYFVSEPARACVAARELPKAGRVEVEAIAVAVAG